MITSPPKLLGITQADLERFQQLAADVALVTKQYDELKVKIRGQLEMKAPIQDGPLTAELQTSERRMPDWKGAFVQLAGNEAACRLQAETPATTISIVKVHRRSRLS